MKSLSVCTTCGYVGKPKSATKGSIAIEIILWFMFIVPGLIYSIWRLTTRQKICAKCKNTTIIPTDTPAGEKLLAERK